MGRIGAQGTGALKREQGIAHPAVVVVHEHASAARHHRLGLSLRQPQGERDW
jgi:hypothetical protein